MVKVLDRCESTKVLVVRGPQEKLLPYLKEQDILNLGPQDRNFKVIGRKDLEMLGVVFDQAVEPQPAEPVPVVESDVGPDELLADVEL